MPKNPRVYITFKIESLKHGNNTHIEHIFDTLVKNNAFLSHNKFQFIKSIH